MRRYQRQNRLDRLRRCRAAIEQIETLEKRLNGSISKREKNYPIMKAKHLIFAMQGLHLIEHGFYELHTDVWLTSFSGEMIIYVFLLGFFNHSCQKEWFKIWKIKDQPNHTNHMKEPRSSHCLVVHEDDHLSYKRYKVKNFVSMAIQGTQVPVYTNTHYFCIFQNFPFFLIKENLKQSIKKTNK